MLQMSGEMAEFPSSMAHQIPVEEKLVDSKVACYSVNAEGTSFDRYYFCLKQQIKL